MLKDPQKYKRLFYFIKDRINKDLSQYDGKSKNESNS